MKAVHRPALAGGLLIALAAAALLNPFRWIGPGDLRWLWPFVAAVGLAFLTATFAGLVRSKDGPAAWASALAATGLALAALLSAGIGVLILAFTDMKTRVVAVSPDGRFEILVHDTANVIDPVTAMYVQTTSGPFSRRAYLGCRNSDTTTAFESARFTGPNTVLIKAGDQWTLTFDPVKVRALNTLPDDVCLQNLYTG